jgi:16S rRNA (guanine966-N2)-methyltransferase
VETLSSDAVEMAFASGPHGLPVPMRGHACAHQFSCSAPQRASNTQPIAPAGGRRQPRASASEAASASPPSSAPDAPDGELRLGKVRAPRPTRGGSRTSRGRVRAQGKGYRTRDYAPPPPGLRVAAGLARGRKLSSPQVHLRPMMSKVREALFSMLYMMDGTPPEGVALDLFAGSGSVGIEALSRGMKAAVFVDAASDCVETIRANLEHCGFGENGTAICARVEAFLSTATSYNGGKHYDLITITPPYEEVDYGELLTAIAKSDAVGEGTFVVVEYPVELKKLPPAIGGRLVGLRNRKYGRTVLAVYACQPHMDLDPKPDEFGFEF